jgi:TRAP-type mannitol/chloroaromatic compound transport system permease large subunit
MKKELWFGFTLMAMILVSVAIFMPWSNMSNGHLGLLMLALVVVAIMLGFPTAFTLMGMGMIFTFFAYWSQNAGHSEKAASLTLQLMVQKAWGVMQNDVLISIPLFVFMGYLVERANLIEKLFKSLHLSLARIPGSLAVATIFTCAVFATATGIVGAVVTLMGLLALPAMLKAGYDIRLSAGAITAGGCLGILIPPSVMLIVYGATAGVSVVQLYAGAFFPGIMLAMLYIGYVMVVAKWKPHLAPPLSAEQRVVPLPDHAKQLSTTPSTRALPALMGALKGSANAQIPTGKLLRELAVLLAPAIFFFGLMGLTWHSITKPDSVQDISNLQEMGAADTSGNAAIKAPVADGVAAPPGSDGVKEPSSDGVKEPPSDGVKEPPTAGGVQEPPSSGVAEPPGAVKEPPGAVAEPPSAKTQAKAAGTKADTAKADAKADAKAVAPLAAGDFVRTPAPSAFWVIFGIGTVLLAVLYVLMTFARLEIFKMLLTSFFPLAVLILAVLGTIVFGLATPTEAAAIGSLGGFMLAAVYMAIAKGGSETKRIIKTWIPLWLIFSVSVVWFLLIKFEVIETNVPLWVGWISMAAIAFWCVMAMRQVNLTPMVRESSFLTAKTSAMVCWLFVGSSIFSAAFALLGGQEIIEKWVLSMNLTPLQFMLLSQFIIFILGWPLEWTEIIVIFMPIFIPLLPHFNVDPLFFGLLVALNLQTAFLSPPVAMAAFYLKGVAPRHVTLNQIFAGMMPFMAIQVLALFLLYVFPQIGLWLPSVLYKQ